LYGTTRIAPHKQHLPSCRQIKIPFTVVKGMGEYTPHRAEAKDDRGEKTPLQAAAAIGEPPLGP